MHAAVARGPDINLPWIPAMIAEPRSQKRGSFRCIHLPVQTADFWRFLLFSAGFRDQTRTHDRARDLCTSSPCRVIRAKFTLTAAKPVRRTAQDEFIFRVFRPRARRDGDHFARRTGEEEFGSTRGPYFCVGMRSINSPQAG